MKRKLSLIVEFLIKKSKNWEKIGKRLVRRIKGIKKNGDKEMNNLSFLINEIINPKRLIAKIR